MAARLRPGPGAVLWPVLAATTFTALAAGASHPGVIEMVTPSKTPHHGGAAPQRSVRQVRQQDKNDLTKVRSALRALETVRSELAGVRGASPVTYDRATADLARLERTLAQGTTAPGRGAEPASSEDVSQQADSADAVRARISRKVIAYARAQIGKPYIYGGVGPRGFDCSGLTMKAYRAAGVSIPRTSDVQYFHTHRIAKGKERPGDLVFFDYHRGMSGPGHVGIVLDPARHTMIAAPHTGTTVKIQNYVTVGRADGFVGFTRPGHNGAGEAPKSPKPNKSPKPDKHREPATGHRHIATAVVPAAQTTSTGRPARTPKAHVRRPQPAKRHAVKKAKKAAVKKATRKTRRAQAPAGPQILSSPAPTVVSSSVPPAGRAFTPRRVSGHPGERMREQRHAGSRRGTGCGATGRHGGSGEHGVRFWIGRTGQSGTAGHRTSAHHAHRPSDRR
jgi:cell wall-associated NlpC family hydrolase